MSIEVTRDKFSSALKDVILKAIRHGPEAAELLADKYVEKYFPGGKTNISDIEEGEVVYDHPHTK